MTCLEDNKRKFFLFHPEDCKKYDAQLSVNIGITSMEPFADRITAVEFCKDFNLG